MKKFVFCVGLSALASTSTLLLAASQSDFIVWSLDGNNDGSVNNANFDIAGLLYVPTNYNPSVKYPVVTYLHGAGAGGFAYQNVVTDNQIDNLLANAKTRNFFLFTPQAPTNTSATMWNIGITDKVVGLIDRIADNYNIDTNRLYVTGASAGGGGLYNLIGSNPGLFAAGVPIEGTQLSSHNYNVLADTPLWIFHANGDGTVNVSTSRNVVNAIRAADGLSSVTFPLNANPSNPFYNTGAPYYSDGSTYFQQGLLRYTEYNAVGHVQWPRVWNDANMYNWMLAQSVPEPTVAGSLLAAAGALLSRRLRRAS